MSYTIEVYRGKQTAERHFGIYSLYVMFYPQLVAGPIERPQNLLHQFREKHPFNYEKMTGGLKLMAWGLFKKMVIADRLSIAVDNIYNNAHSYTCLPLIIATVFFAFEIYCDFSGYSDIAIGAARTMGFTLMRNFDSPYQSSSIEEFWKRWHISLSTWFKDYLYIPLGGNRVKIWRWYLNLTIVFLMSGLWHGANWTFIFWGGLHAFYLIFAISTRKYRQSLSKSVNRHIISFFLVVTTFSLVTFAWIFFRASNIHTAFYIIKSIITGLPQVLNALIIHMQFKAHMDKFVFALCLLLIVFLQLMEYLQKKYVLAQKIKLWPLYLRWTLYFAFILAFLSLGVFDQSKFIYFQY